MVYIPAWWLSYLASFLLTYMFLYRFLEIMPSLVSFFEQRYPQEGASLNLREHVMQGYLVATCLLTQLLMVLSFRYPVACITFSIVLAKRRLLNEEV